MSIVYAGRRLVQSNLGWFKRTRETLGESAGRERAININAEVIREWFPSLDPDSDEPLDIRTLYLSGSRQSTSSSVVISDDRTIRRQGGGKNWRLAGDAIPGDLYDMRTGDLMLMAFDKSTSTLAWVIIRQGGIPDRPVSNEEQQVYALSLQLLGSDRGNMWLIDEHTIFSIAALLKPINPFVNRLLMLNKEFLAQWRSALKTISFHSEKEIPQRFLAALMTKKFCILTGLSGSGKTLLARSFVRWICQNQNQYALIPVGANWIGNENIVGYPDALDESKYHRSAALDIILNAIKNPKIPYFLILDEMNLSHVERYFADFLSAIESPDEPLYLHGDTVDRSGVPPQIPHFPGNLFVIGTVNVDETTYMFSPKVLDRAQVIEFRAPSSAIEDFINNMSSKSLGDIESYGSKFGELLVNEASDKAADIISVPKVKAIFGAEIILLTTILAQHRMEVGFRSVIQMSRYFEHNLRFYEHLTDFEIIQICRKILDQVILQKILPKLSGTKSKLGPVLNDLTRYSEVHHNYDGYQDSQSEIKMSTISNASEIMNNNNILLNTNDPFLPLTLQKLMQMNLQLEDGFAAFAEA